MRGSARSIPKTQSAVVLGCGCGYAECSNVTAVCEVRGGVIVVWSDFRASIRPFGEPGPRGYAGLGPFEFAAEDYRRALSAPVRRTSPVRETHDIERLAAGFPRDRGGWLREMTMAFGRDFLTPYEPEQTREALGCRAVPAAGVSCASRVHVHKAALVITSDRTGHLRRPQLLRA